MKKAIIGAIIALMLVGVVSAATSTYTIPVNAEKMFGYWETDRVPDPYDTDPPIREVSAVYKETKDIMQFILPRECNEITDATLKMFFLRVVTRERTRGKHKKLTFSRVNGNVDVDDVPMSVSNLLALPRTQSKKLKFKRSNRWYEIDMTQEAKSAHSDNLQLNVEVKKTSVKYKKTPDRYFSTGNAAVGTEDFYNIANGKYDMTYWIPSWDVSQYVPANWKNNHPYLELECEVDDPTPIVTPTPPPPKPKKCNWWRRWRGLC